MPLINLTNDQSQASQVNPAGQNDIAVDPNSNPNPSSNPNETQVQELPAPMENADISEIKPVDELAEINTQTFTNEAPLVSGSSNETTVMPSPQAQVVEQPQLEQKTSEQHITPEQPQANSIQLDPIQPAEMNPNPVQQEVQIQNEQQMQPEQSVQQSQQVEQQVQTEQPQQMEQQVQTLQPEQQPQPEQQLENTQPIQTEEQASPAPVHLENLPTQHAFSENTLAQELVPAQSEAQSQGNVDVAPAGEVVGEAIQTPVNAEVTESLVDAPVNVDAPVEAAAVAAEVNSTTGLLPADTNIETLMALAEERGASDIHFATNYPVMLRVHGELQDVTEQINPKQAESLAMSLVSKERQKEFVEKKELDFSYTNQNNTRFRVNLFFERGNPAGALRLIVKEIKTIADLELPDILYKLLEEPYGLILVVGPTGSGKSTTLAAMINHINTQKKEHIITVEDPIEYVYPISKSMVDQREVGADTLEWKNALKSILREDPNVVLVGEMRDLSTIEATITIAETGHLTFATLHTNSAAQAIDRIIDVFPEGAKSQIRSQLANVITAVISQRLIPVKQGGRRAALEIMLGTVAVRNAIREGKTYQIDNMIQTSGDLGMITLEKSLVDMVKKDFITREEAKAYSSKPEEIDSLLARGGV